MKRGFEYMLKKMRLINECPQKRSEASEVTIPPCGSEKRYLAACSEDLPK